MRLEATFGQRNRNSKMTDAQAYDIWQLRLSGKTQEQVAQMFCVKRHTVNQIWNRRLWLTAIERETRIRAKEARDV